VRKGSEGRSDEEEFVGKRKIIRKKRAEWFLYFLLGLLPQLQNCIIKGLPESQY
jgi:hypothetical protein